jgi:hypothetical protein
MYQEDAKVDGIKVGDDRIKSTRHAPSEPHDIVPRVVDFSCHTPPSTGQQLCASLGLQKGKVRDFRAIGVSSKGVLLPIRSTKDEVPTDMEHQDEHQYWSGKMWIMIN